MALPVTPKIGGKSGGGLSLKSDMAIGKVKAGTGKAKVVGSLKKNPGKSMKGKSA